MEFSTQYLESHCGIDFPIYLELDYFQTAHLICMAVYKPKAQTYWHIEW